MRADINELVNVGVEAGGTSVAVKKGGQVIDAAYGTLKKGADSSFYVVLSPKEGDTITKVKTGTSCGCTVAKVKSDGSSHRIKIEYDTKRMGAFKKSITIQFELNGEVQKIFFKLTGKVVST